MTVGGVPGASAWTKLMLRVSAASGAALTSSQMDIAKVRPAGAAGSVSVAVAAAPPLTTEGADTEKRGVSEASRTSVSDCVALPHPGAEIVTGSGAPPTLKVADEAETEKETPDAHVADVKVSEGAAPAEVREAPTIVSAGERPGK